MIYKMRPLRRLVLSLEHTLDIPENFNFCSHVIFKVHITLLILISQISLMKSTLLQISDWRNFYPFHFTLFQNLFPNHSPTMRIFNLKFKEIQRNRVCFKPAQSEVSRKISIQSIRETTFFIIILKYFKIVDNTE